MPRCPANDCTGPLHSAPAPALHCMGMHELHQNADLLPTKFETLRGPQGSTYGHLPGFYHFIRAASITSAKTLELEGHNP